MNVPVGIGLCRIANMHKDQHNDPDQNICAHFCNFMEVKQLYDGKQTPTTIMVTLTFEKTGIEITLQLAAFLWQKFRVM